jgi:hypothetical protein
MATITRIVKSKGGRKICLTTDDTLTLAIGVNREESTPRDLATLFSPQTLRRLAKRATDAERWKIQDALLILSV